MVFAAADVILRRVHKRECATRKSSNASLSTGSAGTSATPATAARPSLYTVNSSSEGLTYAPTPCDACEERCAAQRTFSCETMRNKGIAMSLRSSLHSWMLLKKEHRDLSTLMVSSSLCWKVKTRMPFGSGAWLRLVGSSESGSVSSTVVEALNRAHNQR